MRACFIIPYGPLRFCREYGAVRLAALKSMKGFSGVKHRGPVFMRIFPALVGDNGLS